MMTLHSYSFLSYL